MPIDQDEQLIERVAQEGSGYAQVTARYLIELHERVEKAEYAIQEVERRLQIHTGG